MSSSEPMVTLAGDSTTATSSTNLSTRSGSPFVCHIHGVAERYVSGTDGNPFRRFVRCPRRKVTGCDFFRWLDDELTPHYLASVQRLKQQKESLETQLQCKTVLNEVLYEKIKLNDDELQRLRRSNDSPRTTGSIMISKRCVFPVAGACVPFLLAVLVKLF